ncbi:MAG: helix-turn-helix domain-containing protein [Burkholderiales bacterium]|nr:helix-turn-helix domain-containing protein [Burkholderiales bacterium]
MFNAAPFDDSTMAGQQARTAELAAYAGHIDRAETLLQRLNNTRPRSQAVEAAIVLARAEIAFVRSRFGEAAVLAEQAMGLFNASGLPDDALRAEEMLPRAWAREGHEDRVAERAADLLRRWESRSGNAAVEGQVRCLVMLVSMHARKFRLDEGIRIGVRAVKLARSTASVALLLPRAGNALAGLYFARACALHPATGWASHLTSLLPSDEPEVVRNCNAAIALLEEMRPIAETDGNTYQVALMGSNTAQCRVLLGEPERALPDMRRFLQVTRDRHNRYMEADALQAVGWAHLVAGDVDAAQAHLTNALGIATSLRAQPLLVTIHYDLSVILERCGEFARALHHYREYARLWGRVGDALQTIPSSHVKRRLEPFYLKRAEAFIRMSLPRSPSAEQIADYAGASVRAIQMAFREYRNTTPHAASLALRYQAAFDALRDVTRETSVSDICIEFGFDDPSRFAREFRKRFGLLPSSVRRAPGPIHLIRQHEVFAPRT